MSAYVNRPFLLRGRDLMGLGGVYASGQGSVNTVVRLRSLGPFGDQNQKWIARPVAGKNTVHIVNESGLGWAYPASDGQQVSLSSSPSEFTIVQKNNPENRQDIVEIRAFPGNQPGNTWFAALDAINEIVIKPINDNGTFLFIS